MVLTVSPTKKIIGILFMAALLAGAALALAQYAPSKFFADSRHNGIGLVRDDKEMYVYYNRIEYALNAGVPYEYSRIEYPPVAVAYLTIPVLFFKTFESYRAGLMVLNAITFLALLAATYYLLSALGRDKKALWFFVLPSFVYFVFNRFDILPVLLMQVALLLLFKRRFGWSFFVLSLLFLTKGYAIVLFPIFFLYYLNQTKMAEESLVKNKPVVIFIIPIAIVTATICIVAGLTNGMFPYIFQSTRFFGYGSVFVLYYQAVESLLPDRLFGVGAAVAAKVLTGLQLLLPLALYIGHRFLKKFVITKEDVVRWSVFALLVYVFFSVYYSPQWFVWLLPLLLLIVRRRNEAILIIVYDLINYFQFPVVWHYAGPESFVFGIVVLVRTIVLVWLAVVVARGLRHHPKRLTESVSDDGHFNFNDNVVK